MLNLLYKWRTAVTNLHELVKEQPQNLKLYQLLPDAPALVDEVDKLAELRLGVPDLSRQLKKLLEVTVTPLYIDELIDELLHIISQLIEHAKWAERGSLFKTLHDSGKFNKEQLAEIREGLEKGLNVSIYAKPEFDDIQMSIIRHGLSDKIDISIYAKPEFNWEQMEQIYIGLRKGLDVSRYADPKISWQDMKNIKESLLQK